MMRMILSVIFAILLGFPASVSEAQEQAWIQIEAHPSLAQAQARVRTYAADLEDVNGFSIGSGWYAVALGPYSPGDAAEVLRVYRADRVIPRDSYISQSSDYRQQFWPVGANSLIRPALSVPDVVTDDTTETTETLAEVTTGPEPGLADETPREARASEALLNRDERKDLQVLLKWAGFYQGAIDGAYGRGTRGSMARWQEANNFEPTGVMTTRQRASLLNQFNAILEGLGLALVRDQGAGIEMMLPTSIVSFSNYEPPFAHYKATGDINARVLLISQEGDKNTLAGLYDIMQTLEIVPETGPRTIEGNAFTLIGEGALEISHTQAWLKDGRIKGFTLIWPAGDEERRRRLLGEMQESFARLEGVLDQAAGSNEDQSIDLLAGLEIRRPKLSRSGFYVDQRGTVVTTYQVVAECSRITIDEDYEAEVAASDASLGIAVLRPLKKLSPITVAAFQQATPRLQSDIAVAGYSYGGILGAPTLTFGRLADLRGLNGEAGLKRLALAALDGDVGGPVVDAGGAVLGMLLPDSRSGRQLPDNVSFAAGSAAVQQVLQQAGISVAATSTLNRMPPEALIRQVSGMTVLVSCWE